MQVTPVDDRTPAERWNEWHATVNWSIAQISVVCTTWSDIDPNRLNALRWRNANNTYGAVIYCDKNYSYERFIPCTNHLPELKLGVHMCHLLSYNHKDIWKWKLKYELCKNWLLYNNIFTTYENFLWFGLVNRHSRICNWQQWYSSYNKIPWRSSW